MRGGLLHDRDKGDDSLRVCVRKELKHSENNISPNGVQQQALYANLFRVMSCFRETSLTPSRKSKYVDQQVSELASDWSLESRDCRKKTKSHVAGKPITWGP